MMETDENGWRLTGIIPKISALISAHIERFSITIYDQALRQKYIDTLNT